MSESYGPYRAHEVAEWFPLLGDAELRELAESIKREGQIEACVVWGSVLVDGRNRWRACELAGVEARIVRREFESEAACGRWIIATNLHRRHLTTTQRAMLAARQLPWFEAQARERMLAGVKVDPRANLPEGIDTVAIAAEVDDEHERLRATKAFGDMEALECAEATVRRRHGLPSDFRFDDEGDDEDAPGFGLVASAAASQVVADERRARSEAAGQFDVSPRAVQSAKAVIERGTPELVAAVERGEVAVSAAEQITKLSHDEQSEVVAAGPAAVREVAAEIRKKPAANHTSLSDLWFTPAAVIAAARELLGSFDLDPASCAEANENVGASAFFTQADDGLSKSWHGRVWCNPPYGRDEAHVSNQAKWTAYMADQYDAGNFSAGCLLVTFVPDRAWFERLWGYPMCAFRDRLKFRVPGGNVPDSPTSANVVVYFGEDVDGFARIFSRFGRVLVPRDGVTEVLDAAA